MTAEKELYALALAAFTLAPVLDVSLAVTLAPALAVSPVVPALAVAPAPAPAPEA